VLKFGVEDEQVALLRKRLNVQSEPGTNEKLFDKAVLDAVKRFQYAHGTIPDGMVGSGTRRMLNGQQQQPQRQLGSQGRIDAILVNMERWRWLPHDLGPFYVTVNIPSSCCAWSRTARPSTRRGSSPASPTSRRLCSPTTWRRSSSIPIGTCPTPSRWRKSHPIFGQGGGFFGGWDTSILQRHGLLIRYNGRDIDPNSIDWSRNDIRNFDLVQPPGPSNVLGRVKFVFPNKHDVYMHDTTQKNLFAQTVRAESHGCMRVQYPEKLAEIILNHDKGWSPARVESTFDAGGDNHVALDHKIPVYITYFTVKVNDDGSLSTFNDIYGHDSRMIAALNGKYVPYQQASDDEMAASQYRPWNKRTRRETIDNDFTRALFGF
jgi:murein L,D-transpeptidase YcbB/YkuD